MIVMIICFSAKMSSFIDIPKAAFDAMREMARDPSRRTALVQVIIMLYTNIVLKQYHSSSVYLIMVYLRNKYCMWGDCGLIYRRGIFK